MRAPGELILEYQFGKMASKKISLPPLAAAVLAAAAAAAHVLSFHIGIVLHMVVAMRACPASASARVLQPCVGRTIGRHRCQLRCRC